MSPRSLPVVALVLALGTLIATMRIVAGGETWSDARYHLEIAPPRLAAARAIQAGELPAWWEGSGLGVPLAGEPSHGAMAPASWLATTPRGLDLVMIAQLFVLALGIAVWARRTTSDIAAIAVGLLVITSGVVASTLLRGALPALAWLPWVGAAADRSGAKTTTIAIGATIGMIGLAGQLPILVDGIALALVLGGARRATLLGIAAGLAISCAQWVPALLAIPHAAGAGVAALPMSRLIELLVPGSFGAADPDRAITAIAGVSAWGPSLYVGAPLVALATVRGAARPYLALIGAICLLALVAGRGGWPGWLGAPELHVAVLAVALAPLAAAGIDALREGERRAQVALGLGGGCAALALAAIAAFGIDHDVPAGTLFDGGLALACLGGAVFLARTPALALALLVAPGFGAAHALAPTLARHIVDDLPRWAELARDEQPPRRLYRPPSLHEGQPPHAPPKGAPGAPVLVVRGAEPTSHEDPIDEAIATLGGASADRFGITAARSDDPARPALHDRTWVAASHGGGVLLDRFGIGLAVLPTSVTSGMTVRATRSRWSLVQLPAAPVAAVVYSARHADPETALGMLFTADGKSGIPRGEILVDGDGKPGEPEPPKPCRIKQWEPGAIDLVCVADRAGYAVISSGAADGWSVTVDDSAATPLDADVLRRAVAVPPGVRAIAWRYTAPGLVAGVVVALAAAAALLVSLLRTRRRGSRATT